MLFPTLKSRFLLRYFEFLTDRKLNMKKGVVSCPLFHDHFYTRSVLPRFQRQPVAEIQVQLRQLSRWPKINLAFANAGFGSAQPATLR